MRRSGILAKRYARALFLIGKDRNILDRLHKDVSVFAENLIENEDFYHFFISPEVSRKEKEEKIEEFFGDMISAVFHNFLLVLLKKRRQNLFLDIAEAFGAQLDVYHNRVHAYAESAIELPPELQEEIKNQLSQQLNKEVNLVPKVNEDILGGIRIRLNGKVIDGSMKNRSQKMRQFLIKQTRDQIR